MSGSGRSLDDRAPRFWSLFALTACFSAIVLSAIAELPRGADAAKSGAAAASCSRTWAIDRNREDETIDAVATSGKDVWAVGRYGAQGLVLHRSRGRWVATPIRHVRELVDVSVDRGQVWATSASGDVLRWSGSRWRFVTVPHLPRAAQALGFYAVDLHAGDVWLAGAYDNTHETAAGDPVDDFGWLTAHRHDGTWRTDHGGFSHVLDAISVQSATDVWAVGTQGVNIASDDEAVLHWNGKRWFDMSRQPDVFALNDVLALSPKDAWAVGVPRTEGNERPASLPVIEHWNGKRWSLLQLDFGWTGVASLSSLASFAADTVWAGGGIRVSPAGATNPVLLQWNGASWQNETPPRVTTPINGLAASADGTLWAVGRSFIAHTNCR